MRPILLFAALLAPQPAWLAAEEKITSFNIVTDEFETCTNKDGTGSYFDILQAVLKPTGIKMTHKLMPYARTVDMVKQKKADAWLASYVDEEDFAIYPKIPLDTDIIVAVYKDAKIKDWKGEESIKGMKTAWLRNYAYEDYLKVKTDFREVNNRKSALNLLNAGRIDVFVDSKILLDEDIAAGKFDTKGLQIKRVLDLYMYVAFAKGPKGEKLSAMWDKRMKELHDSGELMKIFKKWKSEERYPVK